MSRRSKISPQTEQAIALALLDVPEFRRKAGLPPRHGSNGGDTLQQLADVLGVTREGVRLIERRALRKLYTAIAADPELRRTLRHILHTK